VETPAIFTCPSITPLSATVAENQPEVSLDRLFVSRKMPEYDPATPLLANGLGMKFAVKVALETAGMTKVREGSEDRTIPLQDPKAWPLPATACTV